MKLLILGLMLALNLNVQAQAADLNGDGQPEVVVAPSFLEPGGVIVLHREAGRWKTDLTQESQGHGPSSLVAITDLTGDGKPEIVWQTSTHGAHTGFAWLHASSWAPGHITPLPGTPVAIATPVLVAVRGDNLVLEGGIIESVGAGEAQRVRTDIYQWDGSKIALINRTFVVSPYAYHKLEDGILAEQFGRPAEARRAYAEAMEPARPALPPGAKAAPGFEQALHTFARFRLAVLLWRQGDPDAARRLLKNGHGLTAALAAAPDPEAGCQAAAAWAKENPAFLEALNSVYGYANPKWDPQTLCGPLSDIS